MEIDGRELRVPTFPPPAHIRPLRTPKRGKKWVAPMQGEQVWWEATTQKEQVLWGGGERLSRTSDISAHTGLYSIPQKKKPKESV